MIMHTSEIPNTEKKGILQSTENFFGEDSPLAAAKEHGGPDYEPRPQQIEMAHRVAMAFEGCHNLCIEAPTGVGKSFAYLVPAVYYSKSNLYPIIISTETISLQEQLINKDIPVIRELLGVEFLAVIAKGRGNYLCKRRLSMVAGNHGQDYLPIESLRPQVEDIAIMAESITHGTRTDLDMDIDNRVWDSICCEIGNCTGPKCSFYRNCFYWKERRTWEKADIIIANHALLFTDQKIKTYEEAESSLLPPYGAVVFDEAHTLEDCAANHLGLRVTSGSVKYLLNKLFDPERQRGILMRSGEDCLEMRAIVAETHAAAEKFFNSINDVMLNKRKDEIRIFEPNFVADSISVSVANLEKVLRDYIRLQEDDDYKQELMSILQKCEGVYSELFDFINMERENHVYWIEKRGDRANIILNAAPLNVNSLLQDLMFSKDFPVVLTSATLSVDGKLDYFRDRTGFMNGAEVTLGTPFDYRNQVVIYASRTLPMPNEEKYESAIRTQIRNFIEVTNGKAFVLFTSYYLLRQTADAMRSFFEDKGFTLLVQGEGKNRTAMLNEFREDLTSVIFGTSSFWMGVDVPGESLSNVIITKLPFAVPTHPLIQARAEKIEEGGKSSFMHYQLPEAVLKFKQGTGRLIRSKQDSGIIVVLDSRIINKNYGRMFLNSIPECQINIF